MLQLIMAINRLIINLSTMLFVIFALIAPGRIAHAQEAPTQTEVDESFDPFADYNEYDQQSEEEEDINFLRNGRYLTLAFVTGYRSFLGGGFTKAYSGNLAYGAEFSYFFNMQLAMGLSYILSNHNVNFASYSSPDLTGPPKPYSGSVSFSTIDFHMKYYFNTDNVTKGLADLNPYSIVGTSYNIRTYSLDESLGVIPDQVWGFKFGAGLEIPLLKHKAYMGFQAVYRYVQFPDENKSFIDEGTGPNRTVSPKLDGDIYDLTILLGLNF
jgi:hypothetical protein